MGRSRAIVLWFLFVVVQILGVSVPRLANIHSNIIPVFAFLLLVPGIAIVTLFGLTTWTIGVAILINAILWYLFINSLGHRANKDG